MGKGNEKNRIDKGMITEGLNLNDDNSMFSWFKKGDDAVQMLLVEKGGKDIQVAVKFEEIEANYEIYSIQGASAKINIDHFINQPLKVQEMGEGITKSGTPKKIGDEADLYMTAWCVNKITANSDEKISRDNFWKLKRFIQAIVFGQDEKLRKSPPTGISKSEMKTIKFVWESHKYKVSMSKEAYRKIEEKVNKRLKKYAKKKDIDEQRKAETELVKILQKGMSLKPGMFASSKGYANYYTVMFKEIFPADFGTDTRIKKIKEDGKWY
jgi:hypothetical protein